MRRSFLFLFIVQTVFWCSAQSTKQSLLSPYLKSGTYSVKQADVFSFSGNQAALAGIKHFGVGAFSERKFMLQELNLFSASIAFPTESGNFGLQLHHFGNTAYNEMQAGLAYGRRLSDYVDVGLQFNYCSLKIAGYGNASTLNFEAGAIFHFTEELHGGVHLYNPTSSGLGKNKGENLAAVYSAGLGYDASENFFVSVAFEKVEDLPLNINTAIQYQFAERFFARGGVATNTGTFFLGLGFNLKSFRADAMASVHPRLGVTPGIMLIYNKPVKD